VGDKPLYALSIVVTMAILREGSDSCYSSTASLRLGPARQRSWQEGLRWEWPLIDACSRHVFRSAARTCQAPFTVTGWLILLLAAGMAGQGLPTSCRPTFCALGRNHLDTSYLLPDDSVIGKIMHTLVRLHGTAVWNSTRLLRRYIGRSSRFDEDHTRVHPSSRA